MRESVEYGRPNGCNLCHLDTESRGFGQGAIWRNGRGGCHGNDDRSKEQVGNLCTRSLSSSRPALSSLEERILIDDIGLSNSVAHGVGFPAFDPI